ncbi:MAG: hypothetical protein UR78_C0011G0002 [Candidatus Moranbacteria bacterium GW2011_GWF2_35_39]|nr:MAG: hypothetical protein UR78_C0011G0002 [Candidatus Moranbacteria bacterium GW2011_GWF2_35_39]
MQTKIKLLIFLLFVGIFLPVFSTYSAGLVPCGLNEGTPEEMVPCTLCHLIIGIFNIFIWFRDILITVAAVGIFIAGVMYIISSGDEEMMKRAKSFLATSLTGFTIVLGAWLIVNSVMWILSYDIKNLGIKQENWYTFTCDTFSTLLLRQFCYRSIYSPRFCHTS